METIGATLIFILVTITFQNNVPHVSSIVKQMYSSSATCHKSAEDYNDNQSYLEDEYYKTPQEKRMDKKIATCAKLIDM